MNPFIMNRDVWATEDKVIPVSTVKVKDYADRMETSPPFRWAGLPNTSHGKRTRA